MRLLAPRHRDQFIVAWGASRRSDSLRSLHEQARPSSSSSPRQSASHGHHDLVTASVEHVRDLPCNSMGVAPLVFAFEDEVTERGKDVLSRLRKIIQCADNVILATDPGCEGKAIAWHLKETLKLSESRCPRVTYHEVTRSAVRAAITRLRRSTCTWCARKKAGVPSIVSLATRCRAWSPRRSASPLRRASPVADRVLDR
ncbi:toprim domain-containing protein [Acidihalobacter yilgarnensis]|uniref:toprim domain-containing protein n=1 Tax=Acidihalobacter yilgarnensis TaxID=2819280 RepID=UPI0009F249AF|nr:toprim domain-containing protein [Acidihalobacter yilgarnensis]